MKLLSYLILRFFVMLFWALPFPVLYKLSDLLKWLVFGVFKYRKDVVEKNLSFTLSHLSLEERTLIADKFYKHFIDISLESLKGLSINPNSLIPRFKLMNPELFNTYYTAGKGIIIYSQHYNNWEWGPICLGLQMDHHIIGIVKHLSNPYTHKYLVDGRSGNNVSVVPTYETSKLFKRDDLNDKAIVFIADQSPYGKERVAEVDFFGNKVKFHKGAAHYACQSNFPVFVLDIIKVKRGYYKLHATLLSERPAEMNPDQLTIRYKDHLEKLIAEDPAYWLWTHKRFKGQIDYS